MTGSRTSSQVLNSTSSSDIHTHAVYTHTGDSVYLAMGCVIQCGASCGWADPIRSEGGVVGSAVARVARSQDNLRPLHPGGMCL